MSEPRYETWPVRVIVEHQAECRRVSNEYRAGHHLEIERGGEYRIDLSATPLEHIATHARLYREFEHDFRVAARIENGEIILWLERKPVKQQPAGPPVEAEQAQHACPGGCGQLVTRDVLSGELACPRCGYSIGERA